MSPPLAERMRPQSLSEFVGQEHLTGPGKLLEQVIAQDRIPSMILWGPPGSGKTTLARIIARQSQSEFIALSATFSGVKDIRESVNQAKQPHTLFQKPKTIIFIDEIHRFNKSQQDALLPHVEDGTITLIGATTENPSFEVNAALLSRSRVLVLNALDHSHLEIIIQNALTNKQRGLGNLKIKASPEIINLLATLSNVLRRHGHRVDGISALLLEYELW